MVKTLSEGGRKPDQFVDINYPEEFLCRPVSGNCPTGGSAQWSTPATAGTVDTDTNLDIGTYEPQRSGKIDGKGAGGIVEFGMTIGVKSSGIPVGTHTAKLKVQARNKSGTYVQIDDGGIYTTGFAITATEVEKTFAGYFPTVLNFNQVPFDLRAVFQSDTATASDGSTVFAIVRVKNSSYVRGVMEAST